MSYLLLNWHQLRDHLVQRVIPSAQMVRASDWNENRVWQTIASGFIWQRNFNQKFRWFFSTSYEELIKFALDRAVILFHYIHYTFRAGKCVVYTLLCYILELWWGLLLILRKTNKPATWELNLKIWEIRCLRWEIWQDAPAPRNLKRCTRLENPFPRKKSPGMEA